MIQMYTNVIIIVNVYTVHVNVMPGLLNASGVVASDVQWFCFVFFS